MTTTEPSRTQEHPDHRGSPDHIHFFVDGERHTTHKDELTPNQIIRRYAEKDPATNYLVRIQGHEKESYEGRGEVPIRLRNGMRFQVICTGPTPVSDR